MKFGYFCNPTDPGLQRDWLAIMEEAREKALFCEAEGFDSFWLAEHHFSYFGRYVLPNPVAMGIDIAARTKRIRIGVGAAIITYW
ncbi:MAG: LLM class flavin-dependent oxidoreductase, partial [Pseudorhodoplanes sp.]